MVVIVVIFAAVVVIIQIWQNQTKKKKCLRQGSNPLDQKPKILAFLLPLIPMLFFLSLQFLAVRLWRHLWREIRTSYGSRSKQNFIPSMRVILPTVKRLGQIGWFFGEKLIMAMLSGAPRRFLNFILVAELWQKNEQFLLVFWTRIWALKRPKMGLYLGIQGEIQKSPRCPGKYSHEGFPAKKSANLTKALGL